ncbi:peptide/nickel transport system ATP-binding protein [Enhydrobacter aerosaccus]|uniref:Peptide/nickel transport system ATP-binding protein n=1 Tax=Enhydrobacter aerosaccus TaxID=225324 RepID=A0A1T4LIM2_9HYPH|nr:ABC transporter ATP-binding protein [Enhydrobacter aerosaccus]SJZ54583.1 peptide/nickel transport system ATP-binding protein [Enhydrobacter aerosaccus]
MTPLLEVDSLRTEFRSGGNTFAAVDGVSFTLAPGETLGIVGESGCGKSVTSLSIMRLVPNPPGHITGGAVRFQGRNLLNLPEAEMRTLRGGAISMIFQEPMTSLNPVQTIGAQIIEGILLHRAVGPAEARARALEMLQLVRIPSPETRLDEYPHQLSGGMRQRVMIAMALACDPKVLIADEPTTALDVTIQAQILDLLRDLRERTGTAIMLITHDLGVVAELAHRVIVMYSGRIVEEAPVDLLFADPQHPYTLGLLGSIPRLGSDGDERLTAIEGTVPNPFALPAGCRFSPRCPLADSRCRSEAPPLQEIGKGHRTACWKAPLDQTLAGAAAA